MSCTATTTPNFANPASCHKPPVTPVHAAAAANVRFHEQPEPGGFRRRAQGGKPQWFVEALEAGKAAEDMAIG